MQIIVVGTSEQFVQQLFVGVSCSGRQSLSASFVLVILNAKARRKVTKIGWLRSETLENDEEEAAEGSVVVAILAVNSSV